MTTELNPYVMFDGNAREAMEFYRDILGGELDFFTFGEFGQTGTPIQDLIMHSRLTTPGGLTLMGADAPPGTDYVPGGSVSVMLGGEDEAELRGYWAGLSTRADVVVPLEPQVWGDTYGQCTDRYGVTWQVNISDPQTS